MDKAKRIQELKQELARLEAPQAGPFYIRHRTVSHRVDVEIVRASDALAAVNAPMLERRGYYTDDGPQIDLCISVHGPFETQGQAEADNQAWTEDL